MKDKRRSLNFLIIVGVTFVIGLIVAVELISHDLRSEGRSLVLLRSLENSHLHIEGEISNSRTFSDEGYASLEKRIIESNDICDDLIAFNKEMSGSEARNRENETITMCADNRARMRTVLDFKFTNQSLRVALADSVRLTSNLKSTSYFTPISNLFNHYLTADYPWHFEMDHVREEMEKFERDEKVDPKTASIVKECFRNLNLIMEGIEARNKMEQTITDPSFDVLLENTRLKYLESYTRHADFGAKSRLALSALSILLLISMLIVLLKLQRTSRSLANLNLTLEEKVASRTEELKAVLHKLEEQQQILTHTAKMGALGEMAGGIAHEINTPLAAISLHAELLALEAAELNEPKLLDGLNSISKIVEKISKIVIGLKRFSRTGEAGARVRTSFEMIVDETLLLCAEKLKLRGVELELCDNDKRIDLECAPEQVSQIILNLLNNAVDAVENSAVRKIAMSCQVLNGVLEVRVSDSGPGIPPEVRDRLMQPFFTTKPIGKGTGLGLSISKGIAASHGGSLELDKLSLQTCFVLKLPVAAPIATLDPAA